MGQKFKQTPDKYMIYEHMKRCLTSLFIREVQIKSTKTYHCTSIKTAKRKKEN